MRLHHNEAAARFIGLADRVRGLSLSLIAIAVDETSGGEIRPGDDLEQLVHRDLIAARPGFGHVNDRVADLTEVVRGDLGRHTDGNAIGAVDQQVGKNGGQDRRFLKAAVEVLGPGDGVHVEILKHRLGDSGQSRLGISHRGRRIAVDRAEVSLTVDQRCLHHEVLRQADHGEVDRAITVRMVFAQHLTDDAGGFLVRSVVQEPQIVHRIEDASLHRLEPVAYVGEGTVGDRLPCISHVGLGHVTMELDRVGIDLFNIGCNGCHTWFLPDKPDRRWEG